MPKAAVPFLAERIAYASTFGAKGTTAYKSAMRRGQRLFTSAADREVSKGSAKTAKLLEFIPKKVQRKHAAVFKPIKRARKETVKKEKHKAANQRKRAKGQEQLKVDRLIAELKGTGLHGVIYRQERPVPANYFAYMAPGFPEYYDTKLYKTLEAAARTCIEQCEFIWNGGIDFTIENGDDPIVPIIVLVYAHYMEAGGYAEVRQVGKSTRDRATVIVNRNEGYKLIVRIAHRMT